MNNEKSGNPNKWGVAQSNDQSSINDNYNRFRYALYFAKYFLLNIGYNNNENEKDDCIIDRSYAYPAWGGSRHDRQVKIDEFYYNINQLTGIMPRNNESKHANNIMNTIVLATVCEFVVICPCCVCNCGWCCSCCNSFSVCFFVVFNVLVELHRFHC